MEWMVACGGFDSQGLNRRRVQQRVLLWQMLAGQARVGAASASGCMLRCNAMSQKGALLQKVLAGQMHLLRRAVQGNCRAALPQQHKIQHSDGVLFCLANLSPLSCPALPCAVLCCRRRFTACTLVSF
jgi:hypothetical protein